jgi:hypothetical protein
MLRMEYKKCTVKRMKECMLPDYESKVFQTA